MSLFWIRIAALTIMLAAASIAFYFKRLLPKTLKAQRSQFEPHWLAGVIATGASLLGIAVILAIIYPHRISVVSYPVRTVLAISGSILGLLGCALMYESLKHLGTNFSSTSGTYPTHRLVTTGPYRYMRHPYYSATMLIIAGLSLLLLSGPVFGLGCFLLFALSVRSQAEEKELAQRFPEDFSIWQKATGKFAPRLPFSK